MYLPDAWIFWIWLLISLWLLARGFLSYRDASLHVTATLLAAALSLVGLGAYYVQPITYRWGLGSDMVKAHAKIDTLKLEATAQLQARDQELAGERKAREAVAAKNNLLSQHAAQLDARAKSSAARTLQLIPQVQAQELNARLLGMVIDQLSSKNKMLEATASASDADGRRARVGLIKERWRRQALLQKIRAYEARAKGSALLAPESGSENGPSLGIPTQRPQKPQSAAVQDCARSLSKTATANDAGGMPGAFTIREVTNRFYAVGFNLPTAKKAEFDHIIFAPWSFTLNRNSEDQLRFAISELITHLDSATGGSRCYDVYLRGRSDGASARVLPLPTKYLTFRAEKLIGGQRDRKTMETRSTLSTNSFGNSDLPNLRAVYVKRLMLQNQPDQSITLLAGAEALGVDARSRTVDVIVHLSTSSRDFNQ